MIRVIRPFTKLISKFKAPKLIRGLVDMYLDTRYWIRGPALEGVLSVGNR